MKTTCFKLDGEDASKWLADFATKQIWNVHLYHAKHGVRAGSVFPTAVENPDSNEKLPTVPKVPNLLWKMGQDAPPDQSSQQQVMVDYLWEFSPWPLMNSLEQDASAEDLEALKKDLKQKRKENWTSVGSQKDYTNLSEAWQIMLDGTLLDEFGGAEPYKNLGLPEEYIYDPHFMNVAGKVHWAVLRTIGGQFWEDNPVGIMVAKAVKKCGETEKWLEEN
ncbi:unnamed protein product [Amoebophrya sp. A120]|nr:unnamed protein product [Amoebophrya sp. A120]|eukprot:GSA120T00009323001.1